MTLNKNDHLERALLIVRIKEREMRKSWARIRAIMERCSLEEFSLRDGHILQRMELTADQANILKRLNIAPPLMVYDVHLKA